MTMKLGTYHYSMESRKDGVVEGRTARPAMIVLAGIEPAAQCFHRQKLCLQVIFVWGKGRTATSLS
jgi:hypothetical protein